MALYKDEIYVTWDEKAGNIINSLYDYMAGQESSKLDIHIFLHQNRANDQQMIEWPDNFIFHFTKTTSQNALQTSLIAYVLENFGNISRELELEVVAEKSKIFFIQESLSQFEELKSMLNRIPWIKNAFTFKLLALAQDTNTEMLFRVTKGPNKRRSSDSRSSEHLSMHSIEEDEMISPRLARHGRRASDKPELDNRKNPSKSPRSTAASSPRTTPASQCNHCERRRGSQPKFNLRDKNFFCMACFLEGRTVDEDLCKRCQRSMNIETEDKATTVPFRDFSRNCNIQCDIPVHETKEASTDMLVKRTSTIASQTELSMMKELNQDLQDKFYALLREIERDQDDLIRLTAVSKIPVPTLNLDNAHALSDEPFRLNEAQLNPLTNKFHCTFCEGKTFPKIEIFEVHLRNVHKKCNCSCEQYFQSREDYLEHFYSIFPLPCFEQRKCPERFRSIPYQAIHHAKVHFADKPYCCVLCYDSSGIRKKVNFKSLRGLQIHVKEVGHDEDDMFLRVIKTEEHDKVPLTGRASAINFSGDY